MSESSLPLLSCLLRALEALLGFFVVSSDEEDDEDDDELSSEALSIASRGSPFIM